MTYRENLWITVYYNNTNLVEPVIGASVIYDVEDVYGTLTEDEPGYYVGLINTSLLGTGFFTCRDGSACDLWSE